MDWLELREDWGVEQKNSSEVNFYFGILTLEVQWWLFCAEGHVNATNACHADDTCTMWLPGLTRCSGWRCGKVEKQSWVRESQRFSGIKTGRPHELFAWQHSARKRTNKVSLHILESTFAKTLSTKVNFSFLSYIELHQVQIRQAPVKMSAVDVRCFPWTLSDCVSVASSQITHSPNKTFRPHKEGSPRLLKIISSTEWSRGQFLGVGLWSLIQRTENCRRHWSSAQLSQQQSIWKTPFLKPAHWKGAKGGRDPQAH